MSSRGSMAGKGATMSIVDNWRALVERLQTEAELCRNEGADDIAALLDEAVNGLQAAASERTRLRAAVVTARDGYISERATSKPVLESWRERTLELLDRALGDTGDQGRA